VQLLDDTVDELILAAALGVPWDRWAEYVDSISFEYFAILLEALEKKMGDKRDSPTLLQVLLNRGMF
jgi:hypothetical protein